MTDLPGRLPAPPSPPFRGRPVHVKLTQAQVSALIDAVNVREVELEDRVEGRDSGWDRAVAARELATLRRAAVRLVDARKAAR